MPLKHNATLSRCKKYLLPGISIFSMAAILAAFFFLVLTLGAETSFAQNQTLHSKLLSTPLTLVQPLT